MSVGLSKWVRDRVKYFKSEQHREGVVIRSSKWVRKEADAFLPQTARPLNIEVKTNAGNIVAYPHLSRAVECVVNSLSDSRKFSFGKMLILVNPYQYAPLCALAVFHTLRTCGVRVLVKGRTGDCDISYCVSEAKNHRVPIMGLYANRTNVVTIELLGREGKVLSSKTFHLAIGAVKGKISSIRVKHTVEKSRYLYDLTLVYGGGVDYIYPFAFDRNGDLRFVFSLEPKTYGFQPIRGGRFLFLNKKATRLTCTNPASLQLFEVDQMGRFYKVYNVEKGSHHDFRELSNGNFVVGSSAFEGRTFEDAVLELDRNTGKVLNEIDLKDYLDLKYVDTSDWAHLNSIDYDEDEKTVMVCLRNLHSVIKINYEKKELVWILGNPLFWANTSVSDKVLKPEGDMKWFFQAHAAYVLKQPLNNDPDARFLIIYDNHMDKRRGVDYFDGEETSFVRIYEFNEKRRTVSLFKSFPVERSTIRSNAILDTAAGRLLSMNGKLKARKKSRKSSVTEFDYDTGEILNEYKINYGFYRAYGFSFAPDEMAQSMPLDKDYDAGTVYGIEPCEAIDASAAKTLPEPVLDPEDATEEDRRARLEKLVTADPSYPVDPEQDMARISAEVIEDVLYVSLIDHQLKGLYLAGRSHSYYRNYADTVQERPEYFARALHRDMIPLSGLESDRYQIVYDHKNGLYRSKYYVEIKRRGE